MIVLVCGGRHYGNMNEVNAALNMLNAETPVTMVVHGDAPGADKLGREWAARNRVHYASVPALWNSYGKKAGYLRNAAMLRLRPDMVVAFPGGRGTEDMKRQARAEGVTVWEPYP